MDTQARLTHIMIDFHFGQFTIRATRQVMQERGIAVRM